MAGGLQVRVTTGAAALWSLTGRRPDRDAENLFRRADEALLEAKHARATHTPAAGWPVGGRRRRIAPAANEGSGPVPQGPITAPVTAPVGTHALRNGHHGHPAHSLQADDVDDVPVPAHDEQEPEPRDGVPPMPQTRRRRATVIDLSGAATTRTPFG